MQKVMHKYMQELIHSDTYKEAHKGGGSSCHAVPLREVKPTWQFSVQTKQK